MRAERVLVGVAVVAVAAIGTLYLVLISSQGGSDNPTVPYFVASFLLAVGLSLLASLLAPRVAKAGLRGLAAGGLLAMALLSAFSIGAAVLVAAIFTAAATVVTVARAPSLASIAAAVAGIAVGAAALVGGLEIAWQGRLF